MMLLFTRQAQADPADIEDHISQDNPSRAASFSDELIAACERIAETPLGWPILPRYRRRGYRRKVHGSYLIIYRAAAADTIEIVTIVHGARNIDQLLRSIHP